MPTVRLGPRRCTPYQAAATARTRQANTDSPSGKFAAAVATASPTAASASSSAAADHNLGPAICLVFSRFLEATATLCILRPRRRLCITSYR